MAHIGANGQASVEHGQFTVVMTCDRRHITTARHLVHNLYGAQRSRTVHSKKTNFTTLFSALQTNGKYAYGTETGQLNLTHTCDNCFRG